MALATMMAAMIDFTAPRTMQRVNSKWHGRSRQHQFPHLTCASWFGTKSKKSPTKAAVIDDTTRKIAIVGSGPSGCYTAKYLHSTLTKLAVEFSIDVFDKMPTPYGLVRYGVAPDHPETKNVQNDFDKLFDNNDNVGFLGNVNVGYDVSIKDLRENYDAVVLAYGCDDDRKLGIENEELLSVISAREFVAWYNGHPDYQDVGERIAYSFYLTEDDPKPNDIRDNSVAIIGHGNVALDCARILAKGRKGLKDTDISSKALKIIGNGVKEINIIGRRGHIQAAFTMKELRELVNLEKEGHQTAFGVDPVEIILGNTDASMDEMLDEKSRKEKRVDELLREMAGREPNPRMPKCINLRFLLNPVKFVERYDDSFRLMEVHCDRTELVGGKFAQRALGTGFIFEIPADLAITSIGYKGVAIPGTQQWFDKDQGVMKHNEGRVERGTDSLGGVYVVGWLKRGPIGIIGTNIVDAKETVKSILVDFEGRSAPTQKNAKSNLYSMLYSQSFQLVDWSGYRRIENKEQMNKRTPKQPREKLVDRQDLVDAAKVSVISL
jgi:adrenodoxin-NADP+ reductase